MAYTSVIMSEQPTNPKVYLNPEAHAALKKLADMERRKLGDQVAVLVERELRDVHGIDPETLEPLAAAGRAD